jgi:predicted flap endonuclease-1-like 5' DNA nuclease
MKREQDGAPATELTPRIGRVASRELALHGFVTRASLAAATERELLAIHGVGPKAIRILREELASLGLDFSSDQARSIKGRVTRP